MLICHKISTDNFDGTDEEQRDRARREYETVIGAAEGHRGLEDIAAVWQDADAHWHAATKKTPFGQCLEITTAVGKAIHR
jgi:hypothetical protein